jgi:hypothetical protein
VASESIMPTKTRNAETLKIRLSTGHLPMYSKLYL